jgi:hypothetical protein
MTISVTSVETRIKEDWSLVRAFFALHPWATHIVAIVGAYLAGWLFKGWPL